MSAAYGENENERAIERFGDGGPDRLIERDTRDTGRLTAAIEAAFRSVNRLEEIEGVLRERLDPIMVPIAVRAEGVRLLDTETAGEAFVVKQIREIADKVEATVAAFSEQLSRLTL